MHSHLFIFHQRLPTVSFFLFILFISLISSHSLQFSNFHLFSTKTSFLSFLLTIWFFSLEFSNLKLSSSLNLSHLLYGIQVQNQENLLRAFQWCLQSHTLERGHKIEWVSSIDLQVTRSSLGKCKGRISEVFKLFSYSSFALIFYFNMFLDM